MVKSANFTFYSFFFGNFFNFLLGDMHVQNSQLCEFPFWASIEIWQVFLLQMLFNESVVEEEDSSR